MTDLLLKRLSSGALLLELDLVASVYVEKESFRQVVMRTSQDICLPERDSGHFIAKLRLMTIASESVGERLYVLTQVALK